jgi:A/G-specific adenine glycosylase
VAVVSNNAQLHEALLNWYRQYQRVLPWRATDDPYSILISEVMLQQTGVERVKKKYVEFLHSFPNIKTLARSSAGDVIRAWSPLGYNRRALNLKKTAEIIEEDYDGELPQEEEKLRSLPGIGPYTAAAVMAFAFHKDAAPVDTNISRVLRRIFEIASDVPKREDVLMAQKILPSGRASAWSQALMDLGSEICLPRKPQCGECPIVEHCGSASSFLTGAIGGDTSLKSSTPYLGSTRYYRGRVVETLRGIPNGSSLGLMELGQIIRDDFSSSDLSWLQSILVALCDDGLILVEESGKLTLPK